MMKKKNLKKRVTGIVAVMVIVAMFLGGTFAYVLNNQHRTDYVHVEDRIFDLTLINNFTAYDKDAWAKDEQVANPILVKSAVNTELETYVPAYVALQLMEYIDVYTRGDWLTVGDVENTADTAQALFAIDENGEYMTFDEAELVYGADKLTSYTQDGRTFAQINGSQTKAEANARLGIHGKPLRGEKASFTYGSKDAYDYILANGATQVATDECDADPIEGWSDSDARDYVSFELDADAILLEDWLEAYTLDPEDPALTGAFWILGDNGWAYWAQPLTQGTQTSELLHNLILEKDVTAIDYYMHVDMAAASRDQIDVLAESKADGGCEMPAELIQLFKALAPAEDDPETELPLMAQVGSFFDSAAPFWPANGSDSGSVTKGDIKTASFVSYIPSGLEQDATIAHYWDISAAGDGTVMAWLKVNAVDSAMYDLYAGGDGGIIANPNSIYLFGSFNKLETIGFSALETVNVMNMSYMFSFCSSLRSLDLSSFDTSSVTTMQAMFGNCASLINLDVSGFDTSKVTNMRGMFSSCKSLTNLNLSGFDTAKVTDMQSMFYGCESLTSLDVSGFDTAKVTDMQSMFYGCESLTSLDVSGFDTASMTNMQTMFANTTVLKQLDMRSAEFQSGLDVINMFTGSGLNSAGGVMHVKDAAQKAFIDGLSPKPESVIAVS